jgi:hypothetical protein
VEEVADGQLGRVGQHFVVDRRHRLDDPFVQLAVELEHRHIEGLERVILFQCFSGAFRFRKRIVELFFGFFLRFEAF